jgi:hypothetical protein
VICQGISDSETSFGKVPHSLALIVAKGVGNVSSPAKQKLQIDRN